VCIFSIIVHTVVPNILEQYVIIWYKQEEICLNYFVYCVNMRKLCASSLHSSFHQRTRTFCHVEYVSIHSILWIHLYRLYRIVIYRVVTFYSPHFKYKQNTELYEVKRIGLLHLKEQLMKLNTHQCEHHS
jgi:hypothetical protein